MIEERKWKGPESLRPLLVAVSELRQDPGNVRRHDERNLHAIEAAYARFGQQKPIVVAPDGTIVAGNGQLAAAQRLGWTHLAVIRTDLGGAEATAYAIADNRTAELAGWDEEALASLLEELRREDEALFESTGFDLADLENLLDPKPGPDIDRIPEPPDAPITRKGDLWTLGPHRLLCGDSGSPADLDHLLDGASIQLVNTDPPYNVQVQSRSNNAVAAGLSSFARPRGGDPQRAVGQMRAKDRPLMNDSVSEAEFGRLLSAWFGSVARVLEAGRAFYVWGGYGNAQRFPSAMTAAGLYFSQAIIWIKEHPVMGRQDFMSNHEWCFYGWKLGAGHLFFGPDNAPDSWEIARMPGQTEPTSHGLGSGLVLETPEGGELYVSPAPPKKVLRRVPIDGAPVLLHPDGETDLWRVKKVNPQSMIHLTEKPVELALRAIRYSSRPKENVLDLFGGSGSTLMAAQHANRRAFLMELDPLYCDVIVRRWEEYTGQKAQRTPAARKPKDQADGQAATEIRPDQRRAGRRGSTPR